MTAELWVPGILVLALGAVAGWWIIRRKSGATRPTGRGSGDSPLGSRLEFEDLSHRRDELYARLRAEDLDEDERKSLELEAARVLQRLDAADQGLVSKAGSREVGAGVEARSVTAPPSRARTLVTGFLFGGGTAALIAVLVFWAGRDATERDSMPAAGGEPGGGRPTAEQPHPVAALTPEVEAEAAQILEHLASEPQDLAARKRLALLYLGSDQYVPAFEQAEAVLAVQPDDIDSLYVQGVVRMTMGQDDLAMAQLDRVLELFPEHVRAMTVQGLVFARRGDRERAASLWTRALEIGGPQPQIENLLAMLESEAGGELPPGHPPAADPGGGASLAAPGEYRVRIEADVIAGFPQTGTLFVALGSGESGPPIAVKRIDQPAFPILVNLGPTDMMMTGGGDLPASGIVTVRLDQDGSVSTRGENDLEGSAEMSKGDLVTVVLN